MSFPKTIEDIVAIGYAIRFTDAERLGKPFQPAGEKDGFVLRASPNPTTGPYYELVYGLASANNFGSIFAIVVSDKKGNRMTLGFRRFAHCTKWSWQAMETNFGVKGDVGKQTQNTELDSFINWAFRYYYQQVEPQRDLPWAFVEGQGDYTVIPALENFDLYQELKEERTKKEEEEARQEEELRQREAEERRRRAQQEEDRERRRREAEAVRMKEELRRRSEQKRAQQEQQRRAAEALKEAQEALRRAAAGCVRQVQEQKEAEAKALEAKLNGAKNWFVQTLTKAEISGQGKLRDAWVNAQRQGKITVGNSEYFIQCVEDPQIGTSQIKQWWEEFCSTPKLEIDF
jgi:hypothetical protein